MLGEFDFVQDRCVGASCIPSELPPQPELPFLEDMGDGWKRLVELDWNVAPGSEGYRCRTFTIPEDVFIVAFAPQVPRGSHHMGIAVAPSATKPDSVYACSASTSGERRLQAAGSGSGPNELPAGVAMPLRAGEQIEMNLHLFNPNDEVLEGRSGMWIKTVSTEQAEQKAEVVLVGPRMLDIPIGRSTHQGTCSVRDDATVFGVSPHMHFTGVHSRSSVIADGREIVLHEGSFDPYDTMYYEVEPVQLKKGDTMKIECAFENNTDKALQWGDSALAEMCFDNFNIYPAVSYGAGPCDW